MNQRDTNGENVKNVCLREDRPQNCLFRVDDVKNVDTCVVAFMTDSQETSKFFQFVSQNLKWHP